MRLSTGLTGFHSLAFDPFTGTMLAFGDDYISQIDMETGLFTARLLVPGMDFDQGSADGYGRAFVASASGHVVMVDFSATGRVDSPETLVRQRYVDPTLDDIAPMTGLGCTVAAPLIVTQTPAGSILPVGQDVFVSGYYRPATPSGQLSGVLINGVPASVDAAGNFFGVHTVQPGAHSVDVEWWDRCGAGSYHMQLNGGVDVLGSQPSVADAINTHITGHFSKTTWVPGTTQLRALVSAENIGDDGLVGPLYMAVGAQLEPDVVFANATGQTVEGLPYIEVLGTGVTLDPGDSTPAQELIFHDPQRSLVRFDPQWLAMGNRAPRFTSAPTTQAIAGQPWTPVCSSLTHQRAPPYSPAAVRGFMKTSPLSQSDEPEHQLW
jgi:hypothetical protein